MCCPLAGNSGGDAPKLFRRGISAARRPYVCVECDLPILVGQSHEHAKGVWDGVWDTFRTCLLCAEIRDHFACDGFVYQTLWSDLEENFFPQMTVGGPCMRGLSAAARSFLCERRMQWVLDSEHERDGALPPWHPMGGYQAPRKPPPSDETIAMILAIPPAQRPSLLTAMLPTEERDDDV
jgi:hypothetical protein